MDINIGIAGLIVFLLLIAFGMRIAFAAIFVGIIGLIVLMGFEKGLATVSYLAWVDIAKWSLSVIPAFIIMGYFAFYSGVTEEFFVIIRHWFGWLPGGLAIATALGGIGLGATTGSGTASCSILAKISFPEMAKSKYDPRLTAGVIAATGTVAMLIPPSIFLTVYGILVEESIAALLLAGIVPGILSMVIYAAMVFFWVKKNPSLAPAIEKSSWKVRFASLKGFWGVPLIMAVFLGGLFFGVFTPTEAGALGALTTLLLALLRRRLSRANLKEGITETLHTTILVFAILLGVLLFGRFLIYSGVGPAFTSFVVALPLPSYLILASLLLMYAILGCFITGLAMIMITIPIVYPLLPVIGVHPIVFGILLAKLVELAQITPPVGINLYIMKALSPQIPLSTIIRGAIPFAAMDMVTIIILLAFPQIILFIPKLAGVL
ncbi:TRAP transporter large permease [Chloroflexota bacterium]